MSKNLINISKTQRSLLESRLKEAVNRFDSQGTVQIFIDHILTDGERLTIARRILVADMILEGSTYYEINEMLQVSPNTFRNIRTWLFETVPEYRKIVANNAHTRATKKPSRKSIDPLTFAGLQEKYPMHFLLFTIGSKLIKPK